jgi:hypothetical protein
MKFILIDLGPDGRALARSGSSSRRGQAFPRFDATSSPTELSRSKYSGYRILRASKDPVPTILGRSKKDQPSLADT